MSAPLITVIMPVYNAEKYVYEAIDSILKQSLGDFEFLIFNDCSTDRSRDIIRSFNDDRIRLIDATQNQGYVVHLNHALTMARGKYIARMDADDISTPDRFQKQIDYLSKHPNVAVCGAWIEFIGAKEGVLEYPITHRNIVTHLFLYGNAIAHPTTMIKRSVLERNNLSYNILLEPSEDYDLWDRISYCGKLHNLPEVLLQYRVHDNNESVVKKEKQDEAVGHIRDRMIAYYEKKSSASVKRFIMNAAPPKHLNGVDLTDLRNYVKRLLVSRRYNNRQVKTLLSHRFVLWCKQASLPGVVKMGHYLLFPKSFFSIRICLSLLINR